MPFERLLFSPCLLPGKTRFSENKTTVEITPKPGETVLFFCIDSNSKGDSNCKNCKLRNELWGNQEGQRICDLLVFYAKDEKRVLCFVELKDNKADFSDATEQVVNTFRAVKTKLKLTNNYTIQAFLIAHHGSVPIKHERDQKILQKGFKSNFIYDGSPGEFAVFLRGEKNTGLYNKQKRKQKRKNRSEGKYMQET